MPTPPDYYAILQVDPRAEKEVIDAAYRRLAAKYHPDVNRQAGAAERMIQLNTAYEVLSDPGKRAGYDAGRRARPRVGNTTLDLGNIARTLLIPIAFGLLIVAGYISVGS